jgi:aminoglycoside phosphotransferase family enzyme/predicted kinase
MENGYQEGGKAMATDVGDFATMLDDLTQVQAFPSTVSVQGPITLIQTHASAVVLAPGYVYKIKKPKNFGFFDYSTPTLRRFFCQQEVRLNTPFAPGIYLGVAPIIALPSGHACFGPTLPSDQLPPPGTYSGRGTIIDFAVVMKRLPETATLEAKIQTNTLDEPTLVELARFVAAFHATTPTNEHIANFGKVEAIRANWEENFEQMHRRVLSGERDEQVMAYVHAFLEHHRVLFAQRIQQGRIRDCHGDLRLQHVYLLDNPVVDHPNQFPSFALLDRIEFNERFRYGDVASEIAFLTMEMEATGRSDLAHLYTQTYIDATNDDALQELLPFYQCYRAYVRGKVLTFLLDEPEISPEQHLAAEQQARTLFALATHYASAPPQPIVLMLGGLMGTGKSTLAHALQHELRWPLFSSDEVRKHLAQLKSTHPQEDAFGQGMYTPSWTAQTYGALHQKVRETLADNRSVLLDASFVRRADRQKMTKEAVQSHAKVVFIECVCDQATALQRLATRWQMRMLGQPIATASDGRPELYEAQKAIWESIRSDETHDMEHIIVNTMLPVPCCIAHILEQCQVPRLACWL